jgi:hypothetical protein
LVEKWIPPSRSEIAEIGKKIEGILGVNIGIRYSEKRCYIYEFRANVVLHFTIFSKWILPFQRAVSNQ